MGNVMKEKITSTENGNECFNIVNTLFINLER